MRKWKMSVFLIATSIALLTMPDSRKHSVNFGWKKWEVDTVSLKTSMRVTGHADDTISFISNSFP